MVGSREGNHNETFSAHGHHICYDKFHGFDILSVLNQLNIFQFHLPNHLLSPHAFKWLTLPYFRAWTAKVTRTSFLTLRVINEQNVSA